MVNLKISPEQAIHLLNDRIDAIKTVKQNQNGLEYYDFIGWCSKTWRAIDEIYPADSPHPEEIRSISLRNCSGNSHLEAQILAGVYHAKLIDYINEIRAHIPADE